MASDASALAFEVLLAGFHVSGLEIRYIHPLSPALLSDRIPLRVNERHQAGNLLISAIEGRHAFVWPSVAHNRADLVPAHISGD